MKHYALILALSLAPALATAQSQEDVDKGYLTTLIEDNLSGDTRDVNIIGFEGALSSAASLQSMTISDSEGIWLTLEDVVLDWNRSALLRGRIEVNTLSAERIIAYGESRSASRLTTYVNAVHPLFNTFDGYMIYSRGDGSSSLSQEPLVSIPAPDAPQVRTDLNVPVMTFETETDVIFLEYAAARQPDTD